LMALGKSDFGLVGLIGGMAGFVSFLNSILAAAVGRFYAVKVGEARKAASPEHGVEECRKWFNTAITIHTAVPVVLVVIGYPVGLWLVKNFLAIPPERVADCVWVWRFTCLTCFAGMVGVPFQAMYTAKQEIAELTIYSFAATTCNAIFLYYMITHPGFWLVKYAGWMCIVAVVPQVMIAARALAKYAECRIVRGYMFSRERIRQLAVFAGAQFWSNFSGVFSSQGQAILVNKYMGAAYNASMTIGRQVSAHALTLSSSLDGAFWPAITNKTGEGDVKGVKKYCWMSMRMSSIFVLVFAIPLSLEIRKVLALWLVNPPDFAAELCVILLAREVLERMTAAYATAIYGYGKGVVRYSWTVGWAGICTVFVSWAFFAVGLGMWSVVIGLAVSKLVTLAVRLYLGRILVGFGFWEWFKGVFMPIGVSTALSFVAGFSVKAAMEASLLRLIATTALCEAVLLPLCWMLVLKREEKAWIIDRIKCFRR